MNTPSYVVAVASPNSWTEGREGRRYPVIERECGHRHRTLSGAQRCLDRLYAYNPRTRTHSAAWHLAEIRHADHSPLTDDERDDLTAITYRRAA